MIYLIASSHRSDLQSIRAASPELWRQVRRYNKPVQLALAAAEDVIRFSEDPSSATLISLAPCQPGSADLYRWGHVVTAGMASGTLGNMRMNPTQTLHAVDNLALSAFAIAHGNRAPCLGLGGAAGQAWCALEAVQERLGPGLENEVLLMAGDQDAAEDGAPALGVAMLFSARAKRYQLTGRLVRMLSVVRSREPTINIKPHAANGLAALLSDPRLSAGIRGSILEEAPRWSYVVPPEDTDGISGVTVTFEIV